MKFGSRGEELRLAAEQLREVASGANPRNDIQQMCKAPKERRNDR
jgi:hypothetical protein